MEANEVVFLAENGDVNARYALAEAFRQGNPKTGKSRKQWLYHLTKAAEAGHSIACHELGEAYECGLIDGTDSFELEVDLIRALKYYQMGVNGWSPDAERVEQKIKSTWNKPKNTEPLAVVEYFDTKTNSEEQEEFSAVSEAFERADDLCEFDHITNIQVVSYIDKKPPIHKWTRYFITK